ncbi:hypothetical protein [Neisseria subflava]|jgi:hypothetical protein|uniref:Uncharacterized protein n=1 Tax=Neisseria subflava TaxID=28449 RepID=A0AAW6Y6F9_NEISU|nr:hypothetical protein [Neisseria subflava]MBB1574763.1 hypothetical protein [Flavobacteriaceae bacterium]MDK7241633.1 hypothetical protein [Neisseria subflava]
MCKNYSQFCSCDEVSFDITKLVFVPYHSGSGNTSKGQKSKFCVSDNEQLILFATMARNKWYMYHEESKKILSFGIYVNNNKINKVGTVDKQGDKGDVCIIEYSSDMNNGIWHGYPSSGKGETIPNSILEEWKKKGYINNKQFARLNEAKGLYL